MKRASKQALRAEQQFFEDPAVDRLMGVLMSLAADHYVLRDRVQLLERHLIRSGHLDATALTMPASNEESVAADEDAAAFATALLRPLLGLQEALGIGGRFSLKTHRRRSRS